MKIGIIISLFIIMARIIWGAFPKKKPVDDIPEVRPGSGNPNLPQFKNPPPPPVRHPVGQMRESLPPPPKIPTKKPIKM